jgi:hypothetical protein
MARVREDLLQCTDERIIEESELLDELARRVAALEDQVQEDREEEEEDDVSVSTRGSMLPPTARAVCCIMHPRCSQRGDHADHVNVARWHSCNIGPAHGPSTAACNIC